MDTVKLMKMKFASLNTERGQRWIYANGDCVEVMKQMPDHSIGLSCFSPPFGQLFTYSDSVADMGNSSSDGEFAEHYSFVAKDLLRITKPGRLCAVHCSDLPTRKWIDGVIGLKDFSGDLVRIHESHGWIYHSRITIWKDPVVEMQRTKALGLLHKQLKKDSSMSRAGMPDYVLLFRAPGENAEPITHTPQQFPVEQWQEWASPVWMTIDQTDVLNGRQAREARDERHICPLQLPIIERIVTLWSNPGDVVFSPFGGIASEGVESVRLGRKYVGVELKESYWLQGCRYLAETETEVLTPNLLDMMNARAAI